MLDTKLENVRNKLSRQEIRLSDALLIVPRFLTKKVPRNNLTWLNRELLGYLREDLEQFFNSEGKAAHEPPHYRFLNGQWGQCNPDGLVVCIETPRLKEKQVFCNIGIQQIETQLAEKQKDERNIYSMSFDPKTGAQFFCYADELERLYDSVRNRLIHFIDSHSHT